MNVCPECGMNVLYGGHRRGCMLVDAAPAPTDDGIDEATNGLALALADAVEARSAAAIYTDLQTAGYVHGSAEWRIAEAALRHGVGIGATVLMQVLSEQDIISDDALDRLLDLYEIDD